MDESPQRAVVVPDRDGVLRIDHPAPQHEAPPVAIVPDPLSEAPQPVFSPQPLEPAVQPQYSQLTPVYAPTPVNNPTDIPQPAIKGMEFVVPAPPPPAPMFAPTPAPDSAYAPPPPELVEEVVAPAPVADSSQPADPANDSAPLLPITSLNSITDPGLVQSLPTPYSQDYEQSIQNVDLDTMVSGTSDVVAAPESTVPAFVPLPVAPVFDTQPSFAPPPPQYQAPALAQAFTNPPDQPPRPAATNPVASYFQSMPGGASGVPIMAAAAPTGIWPRFKVPILIAIGVIVLGLGALGVSAIINSQNVATTPPATETPVTEEPVEEEPAVIQPPVGLAPEPETPVVEETPVVVPPTPVPVQQAPTAVNTAAGDVDAQSPDVLTISRLGIKASVQSVGMTTTGAVEAPSSVTRAGWYSSSALPGSSGAVLIDGHSSSRQNQLFQNLASMRVGDTISVKRHDGKTVSYGVSKVSVVDRSTISMTTLLRPYGNANRGLNIIAASGPWITGDQTQRDRVVVYAVEK